MEGEEMLNEDQLLDFCQKLGLNPESGCLDERQLQVLCRCIGLNIAEEMMKDLFEELDVNKDGRVSILTLSLMLKGMNSSGSPVKHASPQKMKNSESNSNLDSVEATTFIFSLLDPSNSGVVDLTSLGLTHDQIKSILKLIGVDSRYDKTMNLNELRRCIEDDVTSKSIPPSVQAILSIYFFHSQFLKSSLESAVSERDKLRQDIETLHQRSQELAQEVDEQNAKLEQNNSKLLSNLSAKYEDQIMELQAQFRMEKELLNQTLQANETELSNLKEDEMKLKLEIQSLRNENKNLEKELERLNESLRAIHRSKQQLENDISRYQEIQKNLQDMETKSMESIRKRDEKLRMTQSELSQLRDTNDELNQQLECLRQVFKTNEDLRLTKRKYAKKDIDDGTSSLCSSSPFDSGQYNNSLAVCMGLIGTSMEEKPKDLDMEKDIITRKLTQDNSTQTDKDAYIEELEQKVKALEAAHLLEKSTMSTEIQDLESSLAALRLEYESTEDYWAQKLAEERDNYEMDKIASDEKFSQIEAKIKEYEELLISDGNKLTPIKEYSMENQLGDLESENVKLREAIELAHEQHIEQMQALKERMELKLSECQRLEEQVKCYTQKCETYEKRLSELTTEAKANASTMTQEDVEMSPSVGATSSLKYEASNKSVSASMPPYYVHNTRYYGGQFSAPISKKAWTHVELGYLNSLKAKIKQREEQCWALNKALLEKNEHSEKLLAEMKYQHNAEISSWEQLQQANQEISRRQALHIQEQTGKIIHMDKILKDLLFENGNLHQALNEANKAMEERKCSNRLTLNTNFPNSFHNFSS